MAGSAERVVCDGGGGALGHPKIYLAFGDKSQVACPYCGKVFEKAVAPSELSTHLKLNDPIITAM